MKTRYKNMIAFVWSEDLQRSVDFYTRVLGLEKVFESDGWCELSVPGTRNAYLAVNRWARDGRPPRNAFVTLGVDGLDDHRENLRAHEVRLKGDVVDLHEHGLRMLKFYDPDGNVVTLAEVEV